MSQEQASSSSPSPALESLQDRPTWPTWTTIRISGRTASRVKTFQAYPDRNVEDALKKVLDLAESKVARVQIPIEGEADVFIDVLNIDGKVARRTKHEVIFQLGDKPPRFYKWKHGITEEIEPVTNLATA